MDSLNRTEIILGILYLSAALSLVITAYFIFIKRFKRAKLEALDTVSLITSRENVFKNKTQFLVVSPSFCVVNVQLLNENEEHISNLLEEVEVKDGEYPFDFDPAQYEAGKYYISLVTESAKILRTITIVK